MNKYKTILPKKFCLNRKKIPFKYLATVIEIIQKITFIKEIKIKFVLKFKRLNENTSTLFLTLICNKRPETVNIYSKILTLRTDIKHLYDKFAAVCKESSQKH